MRAFCCTGLFALWLMLAAPVAFEGRAALPNYLVHGWQAEDGLRENTVTSILQTRDGYLWIGTYNGLVRFDGVRFEMFDNNNTPAIHDRGVTSLFEAGDGTLWIGHARGEVTRYRDRRFEAVPFHADWGGGKIYDLAADDSGDVWAVDEEGLLARVRDGRVLTPQPGHAAQLVGVTASRRGTIWVARDGQLSQLENGHLETVNTGSTVTNSYVQGIGAARDGGVWVVCDGRLRKWKDHGWSGDWGAAPWPLAPCHRLMETSAGCLAAATSDYGFYLWQPGQPAEHFALSRNTGFATDWMTAVSEDREGDLWVGTAGAGLQVVRPTKVRTLSPQDEWQGRAVLSVEAGRDGTVWVGTEGAGLYRLRAGAWQRFSEPAGIRNPYIWSVREDPQGELWLGTWGGGLLRGDGGRFEVAPGMEQLRSPMPALVCAREGGLWVGTEMGLLHYQVGRADWFAEVDGKRFGEVRAVVEAGDGTVWFGTSGSGLGCVKHGKITQYRKGDGLASDFIASLHVDADGVLWVGTFGGGLNRFKQGRFSTINRKQGLHDDLISHIEDDGLGFFWLSSHDGIIRVSRAELDQCADGALAAIHCLTYGMSDGLPTLQCTAGGCRTEDGRLWLTTSKGLVIIDPRDVHTNQLPPPVVIENLRVDEAVQPLAPGAPAPDWPDKSRVPRLKIPPGRHRFAFQYTGLSFVAPEKVRFRHRLEGMETDWVNAGTKRSVDYSYIPPGNYSFHVTACNNDGVWNDTGAGLAFEVLPHFWQTLWFRFLGAGALVAGSGGGVWFETRRRMRRKLERSERRRAIEFERARIAADIHDDLGAQLTRITMLSESAAAQLDKPDQTAVHLQQIYQTGREVTRAMDEIVWAVNPKHDTLESLVNYLEKFAQDFLKAAGIRCRLEVPMDLPAWSLTSEVRHNLFLALKEALNNAVKHASPSEVRLAMTFDATSFSLLIEDDGRGVYSAAPPGGAPAPPARFASGNGLDNMRRRLEQIGGRCDIAPAGGGGTRVLFVVRAKNGA